MYMLRGGVLNLPLYLKYYFSYFLYIFIFYFFLKLQRNKTELVLFLIPLLIITILGIFLNNSLFPLIFPSVTIIILGAYMTVKLFIEKKRKVSIGIFSIFLVLISLSNYFFIKPMTEAKLLINRNEKPLELNFKDTKILCLNGKSLNSKTFLGKNLLLEFSFNACGACKSKLPMIIALAQKIDTSKTAIIIMTDGSIDTFQSFKRENKKRTLNNIYVLYDTNGLLAKKLNIINYPTEILFNKHEKSVYISEGFSIEEKNTYTQDRLKKIKDL